jgi:hypothetical protein
MAELPADAWRTNNAAESPMARPAATDAQVNYIKSLIDERDVNLATAPQREGEIVLDVKYDRTITKADAHKAIDWLKGQPRVGRESAPSANPYPDVPAGHYAIPSLTGNNDLDFFRVDRPTEGKWSGRTFVKRVIGGHPDTPIRGSEARKVLNAILEAGVDEAGRRYGQEVGRCRRCNRHLTDETSRQLGIGPDCINR